MFLLADVNGEPCDPLFLGWGPYIAFKTMSTVTERTSASEGVVVLLWCSWLELASAVTAFAAEEVDGHDGNLEQRARAFVLPSSSWSWHEHFFSAQSQK